MLIFGDRLASESDLDPRHADYLSRMMKATGRLKHLVEDVLTLVRVTGDAQREWVELDAACEAAVLSLDAEVLETRASIDRGSLPRVWADPEQMELLFRQLLANALKFRGAEAPEVEVRATITPGRVRVTIADNGIGFDPRYSEKIFTVFQRLHQREAYPGTGIGLAICHAIVLGHDGEIGAFGEVGRGATFEFELPLEPHPVD